MKANLYRRLLQLEAHRREAERLAIENSDPAEDILRELKGIGDRERAARGPDAPNPFTEGDHEYFRGILKEYYGLHLTRWHR